MSVNAQTVILKGVLTCIISLDNLAKFKYTSMPTTSTKQNCIREDIKSRLQLGNAFCRSVQNFLSFYLLSKHIKIEIYKTMILCFRGHEIFYVTLREW
jgi:hypothetical protein